MSNQSSWNCVLELDGEQKVAGGGTEALVAAILRGADLRIHTDFRHNEHVDLGSENSEMVNEVSEFHETCVMDDRWAAGFMTTRQPVALPDGFGPPSMSFFMYNQDGRQAIARPYLAPRPTVKDDSTQTPVEMAKYHEQDSWDEDTNAPCSNFVYDFEVIRYFVRDDWREVLAHDEQGQVTAGSIDALHEAFLAGCEVKVGVMGLYDDLAAGGGMRHEVFIQTGWGYYYSEQKLFVSATHPLVRVCPGVPLVYRSGGWDFGWLVIRTDGYAVKRICDPHTLALADEADRFAVRWLVR